MHQLPKLFELSIGACFVAPLKTAMFASTSAVSFPHPRIILSQINFCRNNLMSDAPAASPATQNFSDPLGVGGPLSTEPGAPGARPGKKTLLDSISVWDIFLFAFGFCIIASTCVFIALFVYQKGVNGQVCFKRVI